MTSVESWIQRSWERFARRWWVLLAVSGIAGAASLLGGLLPGLGGVFVASLGRWPTWAVTGVSGALSLLLLLWLSTWAQAAAVEAAAGEADVAACLADSWAKTGAFAWTLSLVLLAAGGGAFLLLLPGLWLTPLLFWAPFATLTEGLGGVAALEASWRRVRGRWWEVAGRLALVFAVPFAVGLVPVLGFFLGLAAGPFTLVMLAEMADELRRLDPGPDAAAPRLALPVAALSAVFLAGSFFVVRQALLAAASLKDLLRAQVL